MSNAIYPALKKKAVLISGGASGMGEAIARSAPQGAPVGFASEEAVPRSRASVKGKACATR
jgi:NAD(P)-dependent dehydrogenase (short-subunit alcohol dehydrogenase family)